jgi:hypothetical protein
VPTFVFLPTHRARPSHQRSTADAPSILRPPQSSYDHVPVYAQQLARPACTNGLAFAASHRPCSLVASRHPHHAPLARIW